MPSNHVLINNAMEYSVPDSRMGNLLRWLKKNGRAVDTGIKKGSDKIAFKATSYSQIES